MKKLGEGKKSAVLQTLTKFIFKKTKFISRKKKNVTYTIGSQKYSNQY
jgi:hypothetical protein